MRASEFLSESATAVLYHYCGTGAALKIMTSGVFKLSNITGNKSEQQYAPPGHPYFLSLTRSKTGDYRRYTSTSACMFVLNGTWFNRNYRTKPIDYWERSWDFPGSDRGREAEDRVFSKTPEIPIDGIVSIHVLLKEKMEYRSAEVRNLLIAAKTRHIPAFLYKNEQAWRLQDTRKAIAPSHTGDLLRGPAPNGYVRRPGKNYLGAWLELIYKNKKEDLSPEGEKLRYNLMYYGSRDSSDDSGLGNEMSNARKPDSGKEYETANRITQYMQKNKFKTTSELKNALCTKWKDIK